MIIYIEKEIVNKIDSNTIIDEFIFFLKNRMT